MLGMLSHPHHESVTPKFAKRYANLGHIAHKALEQYCKEVESGAFPSREYSPYAMAQDQRNILGEKMRARGLGDVADLIMSPDP